MTGEGIWIHILWATKNYERWLVGEVLEYLQEYLLSKSDDLGIPVEKLEIQPEHVHLLIDLTPTISLSDYLHEMKGASSWWINKNRFLNHPFRWQKGFDAYSVSEIDLPNLLLDLENQTSKHQSVSFLEERMALRKENAKELKDNKMGNPEKAVVVQLHSLKMEMKPGTYFWCSCGRSNKQPFCDGSHRGTAFRPEKVVIEKVQRVAWCMCRHSKKGAICDNKHRELDGYVKKE